MEVLEFTFQFQPLFRLLETVGDGSGHWVPTVRVGECVVFLPLLQSKPTFRKLAIILFLYILN